MLAQGRDEAPQLRSVLAQSEGIVARRSGDGQQEVENMRLKSGVRWLKQWPNSRPALPPKLRIEQSK